MDRQAKLKVLRAIVSLEKFTVAEVMAKTGLDRSQVNPQIARLRLDEIIHYDLESATGSDTPRPAFRPMRQYRLTSDQEKRSKAFSEIRAVRSALGESDQDDRNLGVIQGQLYILNSLLASFQTNRVAVGTVESDEYGRQLERTQAALDEASLEIGDSLRSARRIAELRSLHAQTSLILSAVKYRDKWSHHGTSLATENWRPGNRVYIFDTTLRDGEESPGCSMSTAEKLAMATSLVDLGVDILEAGFPIASEDDFETVDAVSRQFPGVRVAALARACVLDIERAAKALQHAKRPRIHTFIATSDIHLKYKLKKSRQQVLDAAIAAVTLARTYTDDVEFSAEDATRTDPDFLEKVCDAVVEAGARTVNLPDTVGYTTPDEYQSLVKRIVDAVGDRAVVSVHCHNDLGLAVANSLAAISAGARQIECTINGIGARAGNAALEEVVMAIRTRNDRLPFKTMIKTEQLFGTSQMLSLFISFGPQPNKAIVGENAFAFEAGIHQDGYLKEKSTYQIIDPATVGAPETRLVLGKHSGRAALKQRTQDLGYQLSSEELDQVYQLFSRAASNRKGLRTAEIRNMVEHVIGSWVSESR